ncbi:chemotaxis protein CheX [Fredinandcohnia humi]
MPITVDNRNEQVKNLLNGTIKAIGAVVPIQHQITKPRLVERELSLHFGVLIGLVGDIRGKLVLKGELSIFGSIGQSMFGMPLEGEMLSSFTGELGNMIAGSLSTNIAENGMKTDISAPTIMQGNTTLSGFSNALEVPIIFDSIGEMQIYLVLDK